MSRAVDGEQCLELVRAKPPDFLILDLLIPKMHGLRMLKEMITDPSLPDIAPLSVGEGL